MKTKFFTIQLIILVCLKQYSFSQTGLPIYQPDFSTQQAGWVNNGNASFGTISSATSLILTPSTGNQAGSSFWKNAITLPSNGSFSAFFSYQIDQNTSRADGFTFVLQQAGNTAIGTGGGMLGLNGISGKSVAIEFDTYENGGTDPDNNHIALDINGDITHSTGVVKSIKTNTLDLADANVKYVWIDYNGSSNKLEVRVSYSSSRPSSATLSTSSYKLNTIFSSMNVYAGFTAGTGGAWERHSIKSFYFTNQYQPITPATTTYAQNPSSVAMTSATNTVTADGTSKLPITITLYDAGSGTLANQPVTVSITSGTGTLSALSGTTNSNGQFVVNLSSNTGNTITVQSVAGYGGISTTSSYSSISALPIVISGFTGELENSGAVKLLWDIQSVDNGKNITILRSTDGVHYDSIGVIEVEGQTGLLGTHTFYDESPAAGNNFYKLELNNLDGKSTSSNIVNITVAQNNSNNIKILGNPLTTELRLSGLSAGKNTVMIYSVSGILMQETVTDGSASMISIPCQKLSRGQYFVKVQQNNNNSQVLAFVKM
ncbi:MAG: Ig-like domain-containing protein [Bacteroidetes bacterium]|nr:Ig-like domain-containing protein [Bacteroidota bacterium]